MTERPKRRRLAPIEEVIFMGKDAATLKRGGALLVIDHRLSAEAIMALHRICNERVKLDRAWPTADDGLDHISALADLLTKYRRPYPEARQALELLQVHAAKLAAACVALCETLERRQATAPRKGGKKC